MRRLQHAVAARRPGRGATRAGEGSPETQNRRSAGWLPAVLVCAPVGIRTPNLLIRSQMLYPLSYRRSSGCGQHDRMRIADPHGQPEISPFPCLDELPSDWSVPIPEG